MEELLGHYSRAEALFECWLQWMPGQKAYWAFASMLERVGKEEAAREVRYRLLEAHPRVEVYLQLARSEAKRGRGEAARLLFEKMPEDLGQAGLNQEYYLAFA
jgi:tetratricopeptide (TPR) repeat protein